MKNPIMSFLPLALSVSLLLLLALSILITTALSCDPFK